MQPKLIISFNVLSESDFQSQVNRILASLTDNPHFPGAWPAPMPSLAQVRSAFNDYLAAYFDSLTRDTRKIALRNELRGRLSGLLRQLATGLEMMAGGDVERLASTGFELRRDPVRVPAGTPPAPLRELRIEPGPRRGSLELNAASQPGALSFEVQCCRGDPAVAADWQHLTVLPTLRHALLEGLADGPIWIRLRAVLRRQYGPWSVPVSLLLV